MAVGLLGPVVVDGARTLAPRDRVVLAALAVRHGEVVSAEALADALWVDQPPPASWAKVVQGCVVRLRKVLGAPAIETHTGGYRLALPGDDVDAYHFTRLVKRARELLTLGQPDRAVFVADEALALWRGRALAELDDWEAGRIEAARLDELRLDAQELRIDAALQAGRFREVLADAQARVDEAPLREHRWMLLALAQHQAGRQGDALRTLRQARRLLAEELGIDPGPDLMSLEGAILRQDPSLVEARLPEPSPVCPYMGLAAYDVDDADRFFGREPEVADGLERLRRIGVLAVVGRSGSGKSSLVRAGLAAALRRAGHKTVVVTPGAHPMQALASLDRSSVLIVDQCEEAVTVCGDPAERSEFFAALAAHAESAPLIVGLRADRLGELTAFQVFADLVERGLYLLTPMTSDQLRAAIGEPARSAGLLLEPGLVDLLVREVEGEPGSLPMLSHAMYQTWQRREGSTLTVAAYQTSGGIRGAVAQSAEQVYDRAPSEHRRMLRDLMLRLVLPNADGEPVRIRVPRRIAAPDPDRERLVDALAEARLVTSDAEGIELAHEALARAWPRLRDWLEDDVEGQRMWRHLGASADAWDSLGRPDSELYRGVRLDRVIEWRARSGPDLSQTEREFLDAAERVAGEQARHRQRTNRRLRALAGVAAVLAIAATAGGVAATRQAERAKEAADAARASALAAWAMGVIDDDPSLAKLLAVASTDDAALHRAWAADHAVARWAFTGEVGVVAADLNPAGDRLVSAGILQPDGAGWTVVVANPFTDELAWSVDVGGSGAASAFVAEPRFTTDGSQVVAGVYWDPANWRRPPVPLEDPDRPLPDVLGANIWDATNGDLVERIDLGRCGGAVTAISPTHVLARTLHGSPDVVRECRWREGSIGVELVDRRTGQRDQLTTATNAPWFWGAAMSADGRYAAFDDGATGEVVVVDVGDGAEVLRVPASGVRDLNADGSLLLVGVQPIEVWDVATGDSVADFDGHNGSIQYARFGPTGDTVYSAGDDGALREWEATSGRELSAYPEAGNGPISVNADGLVAVSNPDQQVVTVIDTERRGEVGAADTCDGPAVPDTLSVVDGIAAVHAECSDASSATTYVVDLAGSATIRTAPSRELGALAVSPDGTRTVDQELGPGPITVSDLRSGAELATLARLPDQSAWPYAQRLRWSADGHLIAAALGTDVAVWDASSGELLHAATTGGDDIAVADVLFTPDASTLIITTSDRHIARRRLDAWDAVTERELVDVDGAYRVGLVGFTPDGKSLLGIGGFQTNSASALVWFAPDTFDTQRNWPNVHEGSVTAAALSPDGSRLATAASDGSVRVWATDTGVQVHEIPGSTAIRGMAFADDRHLVIAPDTGGLETLTIDSRELLELVQASLTRGFSQSECKRFEFFDDCPTLVDLRSTAADVDRLNGVFRVVWTGDQIRAVLVAEVTRLYAVPPDPQASEGLEDLAGTYTLALDHGRFELVRDGHDEPACTGNYELSDDRAWLRSERGSMCYPIKLLDAPFEVTDDDLRLDGTRMRAELPWLVVLGSRPLDRVS